ncbi:methyltransferase FkbM [Stigmatella sp. ncwal1]|uniref:Methyltransferase FkbM n=1 Tax=Stigmatella ashevillensis TaxID=2995309 RepID=A0ABT5D9I6_9BACT|nr:methyltransferase FkbM [Stigmatella ashevillena]MDC0709730.1 methyltransferase FkbM [Stigmatella ashevillena]
MASSAAMHRPLTRLSSDAPLLHRFFHSLGGWRLRPSQSSWKLAHGLVKAPPSATVLVNGEHPLSLSLDAQTEWRIYQGVHEQTGLFLASQLATPGGLCIDMGAHIGLYSVLLASLVGPQGRVISFEPSPSVRERLLANTQALPQVTVLPWSEVRRLDELPEVQAPRPIDLLHIDGAGWEPKVFDGAPALLRAHRFQALLLEVGPGFVQPGLLAPLFPLKQYALFKVLALPSRTSSLRLRPALVPVNLQQPDNARFHLLAIRRERIGRVVDLMARGE